MKYFVKISNMSNSDQTTQNGIIMLATDQQVEATKDFVDDVEEV